MRSKFRAAPVSLVVAVCVVASGCTAQPSPPNTPAPTTTPLFASDEEALAAAEEAYAAYLAVTDQIFAEGGNDLTALKEVAVGRQLKDDSLGFEDVASRGYRSVGTTKFSDVSLQQFSPETLQRMIVVYLCEDVSDIDVFDPSGASVVQSDRPDRVKYEVAFDAVGGRPTALLVSNREPWGNGRC